jgi:hypothetical protein
MSRRGSKSSVSPRPTPTPKRSGESPSPARSYDDEVEAAASTARLGERLRRVALGLLASLITARAYWPGELDPREGPGSGLLWDLAVMIVAGLALASSLIGGRFRFRCSWTDAAVVTLMFLVGLSSTRGLDRRVAINLAWDWAGLGFAYILTRNLPRTRGESTLLAGALVVTAVALSAYGLYQVRVEFPELQAQFLRSPRQMLRDAGVPPEAEQIQAFKDRLLGSNEPYSTFGLPNSLAGFLLGPLVLLLAMVIQNLASREAKGSRWVAIGLAAIPLLCLLTCLILTKSRSAYIGLFFAIGVLAWQAHGQVPIRQLVSVGIAGLTVTVALVAAGLATGRLDREVLTQSTLSMRYRWEYWQGAWGVITEGAPTLGRALEAPTFWAGVGPGNFSVHYLRYKLPQSSEEIQDPHNLFLEVWATAGFWALLALLAALGLGLWNLLGPARITENETIDKDGRRSDSRETPPGWPDDGGDPPKHLGWLAVSAGFGLGMVLVLGEMNLFKGDLFLRWLILVASWLATALLGLGLWRGVPIPAPAFGAAALAVVINLLAAGGIGFPTVALSLWLLIALGLNLRADRPCGRLFEYQTRLPGFALAILWAALVGSFAGAIAPFWLCEAAIARADEALRHQPPDFERAQAAYETAKAADRYSARPWLGDAYLQLLAWESHGSKPGDLRWKTIPVLLLKAASAPRNPDAWTLHSERAKITRDLLSKLGPSLSPRELLPLQASIVEASRTASRLYPTNATLRARLAEASAEMSMFEDAVTEAQEALRLDGITPHLDKKLPEPMRKRLKANLPDWTEKASQFKVPVK